MQDGNARGNVGILYFRVAGERANSQLAIAIFYIGKPGDEIEVNQMLWISKAQLHQRDQALAAGQHFGVHSQLREHRGRLF